MYPADGHVKTVKFRKDTHYIDIMEAIQDAAREEIDYGGLCNIQESNIYCEGKPIQVTELITKIKLKRITESQCLDDSDFALKTSIYFKTVKYHKTSLHLTQIYNLLEQSDYEDNNVDYIVDGYIAKTKYTTLTFQNNKVDKIELFLVFK